MGSAMSPPKARRRQGLGIALLLLVATATALAKVTVDSSNPKKYTVRVPIDLVWDDPRLGESWRKAIKSYWNNGPWLGRFKYCGRSVEFVPEIQVIPAGGKLRPEAATIRVKRLRPGQEYTSHVRWGSSGFDPARNSRGEWGSNEDDATIAHEFGHLLGLLDEYDEHDANGNGVRDPGEYTTPKPGFEGSIMAEQAGKVVQGLVDEAMRRSGVDCKTSCGLAPPEKVATAHDRGEPRLALIGYRLASVAEEMSVRKETGCGRATGDIHMETFDGQRYDLQAAGEFVAVKDVGGEVVLQIRLEPWGGSRSVSVATAVAARVDGAVVAIHLKPIPHVYLDGQPLDLKQERGISLGKAGRITLTETSWVIAWPDGTLAGIQSGGRGYLDVVMRPGSAAGKLLGLLGNADGNPERDLITRDGVVLPAEISFKNLYGRFAESWRVNQKESLFHYAAGESTGTFTDRGFPSGEVSVATLGPAARAKAEGVCRAAGITDPAALDECILDVAVTGDQRFVVSAALAQAVTGEPSPPGTTAGKQMGSLRVAGTGKERYHVLDATGQRELTGYIATNSTIELLPGTYVVKVGDRSMTARVHAGQQTNVSP